MKQTHEINDAIQSAFRLIQQKREQSALELLQPFTHVQHPDLQYLTGICHKALNNWSSAITALQQANNLAPRVEVQSHLAKCYWQLGDFKQAKDLYLAILEVEPQHIEVFKNLALLHLEQNHFESAASWSSKGHTKDSSGQFTKLLGDIEKAQGHLDKAIELYLSVPKHSPIAYRAVHNLGVCYKLQAKFDQAIQCFHLVHRQSPEQYEPLYNLGDCFFAKGQFEQAQEAYQLALKRAPYNTTIHQSLNELYWQNGQQQRFAKSLLSALETANNKLPLIECLAELYWNTGQYEACKQCILQSNYADSSAVMLTLQGRLAATKSDFDIAFEYLDKANKIVAEQDRMCEQAKFAIQLGKFDNASALLEKVLHTNPNSQLALAWLSVVYQATDEKKHRELCNPEFILTTELQTPDGYTNREEFISELESCLLTLHQGKQAPSEQTLVNGSQVSGGLLNRDIEIITKTKVQLLHDIEQSLKQLNATSEHPFLAHLNTQRQITGSWSVKLTEQGFHVSHIHPAGWISVVLYINTPEDDTENGVIEFGRPPLAPPYDFQPFRTVKPKRGQIVIFPSYFWHGTQPFTATENSYRMTLPLDIGIVKNESEARAQ
ncbi:2OG-Fe(II) oxygenase family protein [Pseudoalteromonas galatheae]|uniref:2OG-Fe(II) oxygenase family protein n=1 Tax=Pseudoalteromonas galatheae TaxID=579562 RepID=UPI0030D1F0D3